ncbi:helix-turn-helix transcriptional regulator [Lentzea flaviverrucosa]|uniref:Predicted transcriptional regulator YheO, contains PAS and DNA-binding HTH domains n=1 Tax=Lentzea flaviverrucosa TaxID=200379 RepID=A0A1H9GL49_9PSEU|nr:PAS domain-containing protein [Lentzea flaviverrucosa]RDI34872.1 putative transcriptional regulator YheO [Lentzea flaviverrucosa]SEQ50835.1 Predicted transcriptional regulator YheO, contains PAS and DNA-binding HTH domains [Lentzea flaviverrucosa]
MPDTTADAVFAALAPVLDGIAATFGRSCEVVLHDYRDPERSVVAVAGSVTGRVPGDAMSEIGLRVLAAGAGAGNEVGYLTRAQDGRVLKCTTLPLRDVDGTLIGALCINIDVSAINRATGVLSDLLGLSPAQEISATTNFSGDLDQVVESLIERAERAHAVPVTALGRDERLVLVRSLNEAGVFSLRGAPARIAKRLGISRTGLYNDLSELKKDKP